MYSQHYDVYSKHCDVYSLEMALENMLSFKIILITTNDVKLHIQSHVLSCNLKQNGSQKLATFLNLGGNFKIFEQLLGLLSSTFCWIY